MRNGERGLLSKGVGIKIGMLGGGRSGGGATSGVLSAIVSHQMNALYAKNPGFTRRVQHNFHLDTFTPEMLARLLLDQLNQTRLFCVCVVIPYQNQRGS